ncbi:MAG: carbohydrate-binding domain-containing protein [Ruminococcaceae bacterium]|nr:carbohydrate-binding domain-containing protein [Oscillospiraceae bacterium]
MKKYISLILLACLLAATLCVGLVACDGVTTPSGTNPSENQQTTTPEGNDGTSAGGENTTNPNGTPDIMVTPGTEENPISLTFNGIQCSESVAGTLSVDGGAFVISKGGFYVLSGDLSDGQIKVVVPKTEEITLIFKNFTASSSKTAPIYIDSCDKATIELAAGTVNSLTDASIYQFANPGDDKPNACIYSADDLTIKGEGTLNVTANYNNGIGCKNDLRIKSGTIAVTAPNNILKGNDSVSIEGGNITLSGGEDAIKSDTTDRTDKGFVLIEGNAKVTITCSDDALQATQSITVAAGTSVTITAGGDALNCPGTINADEAALNIISQGADETPAA